MSNKHNTPHQPALGAAAPAPTAPPAAAPAPTTLPAVVVKTGHVVAPGKSVTTLRGLIDAGEAISEADFIRGAEDFAELVKNGALLVAR